MEVLFEIDQKTLTVEQLEQQERDLLAQAETVRKAIANAKLKEKEVKLHKITEIVKNLYAEYGEDFKEVVKKEIGLKAKRVVIPEVEKEDYNKYLHLFNRGYSSSDGITTVNQNGQKITSAIPAQKTFEPYFTMSPTRFAALFKKYN